MNSVVVGLGFGDEGKGAVVDALARRESHVTVVRYNGGCQAGHNVVDPTLGHHEFSQVGAGTLAGANTFLSRFMYFEPRAFAKEVEALNALTKTDILQRVWIDHRAPLTTPYHQAVNKGRAAARGMSCGRGIGETSWWRINHPDLVPTVGDVFDRNVIAPKLQALRDWAVDELFEADQDGVIDRDHDPDLPHVHDLASLYVGILSRCQITGDKWITSPHADSLIFEGAQGVLLDEEYGFHPYNSWTNTTTDNALTLLNEAEALTDTRVLGITRSYATRHGAGPFPTEDDTACPKTDQWNVTGEWQGEFRVGWPDFLTLRYAIDRCAMTPVNNRGVDGIVITHGDYRQFARFGAVAYTGPGHSGFPADWEWRIPLPFKDEVTTNWLQKVTPVYAPIPTKSTDWMAFWERQLNRPLAGMLSGGRHSDADFPFFFSVKS